MGTEEQPAKKPKQERAEMTVNRQLRPILAEEFTRQPILEKCFVGILKDKRSISKAIGSLATSLPSPQHLKRCSDFRIYLCPTHRMNGNPEDLKLLLSEKGFDLSLLEDNLEIAEVPLEPPKTKTQMAYASKFWPVNFHPDLSLESLISGKFFNDIQLSSLKACMEMAILAAEETAVGSSDCNGSALIIDPEENRILAIVASKMDLHPMWHASMLAVDLVARLQGGGTWKLLGDEPLNKEPGSKRKHHDDIPLRYPASLSRIEVPKEGFLIFETNEQKRSKEKEKCGPYLCTGYWAVLLQEPCPLCAMALLHSRISKIFYGAPNPRTGIVGSREMLHSVPGLNHRYQVWSSLLEEFCVRALEKCRRIDD